MSTDEMNEFEDDQQEPNEVPPEDGASEAIDDGLVVAEPKQPVNRGTIIMFAVLVLGAGSLYVMYRRTGPQSASAGTADTKEAAEAKRTISSFLRAEDDGFKSMEARLKNTEKVVQQFAKYPTATQVPLNDLMSNPFRQHAQVKSDANNAALSEAAEKKRRDEERVAIRKAAEGLQLQSIMCSETRKACMINNTLYREGQTINGFSIDRISPSTVEVKNGSYRFQLRIDK